MTSPGLGFPQRRSQTPVSLKSETWNQTRAPRVEVPDASTDGEDETARQELECVFFLLPCRPACSPRGRGRSAPNPPLSHASRKRKKRKQPNIQNKQDVLKNNQNKQEQAWLILSVDVKEIRGVESNHVWLTSEDKNHGKLHRFSQVTTQVLASESQGRPSPTSLSRPEQKNTSIYIFLAKAYGV